MNLDINWLEDFLALSETRNFSRAATLRHITQPAFGRHIRSLEAFVGQTLVDRSTTPVTLTQAGRQFRPVANNIVKYIEEGVSVLKDSHQSFFKPVRINSPHMLASSSLLDLMDMVEGCPAFKVDILRVDYAVESLTEGDCDFLVAFEMSALLQPPFKNMILGRGDYLLVCAAKPDGEPLFSPNEGRVPFLQYSSESFSARLIERHSSVQPDIMVNPIFETSMGDLQKKMVLRGRGVAWIPDCLIKDELEQGKLVAIKPEVCRIPYQIRIYRNTSPLSQEAENLWNKLAEKIAHNWLLITPWYDESQ
ncbi:MAG: LysR family transcriptional regulator [Alteromonadaceae bacterium]|nr:LysR family transcriptional regulator [Alteromonadaceae bacterium]